MTINIQAGHVARHTPKGAGAQGREAAIIDIAQDLLLRHLEKIRILDCLVFKGGTSLRKLYAGAEGRFSLDLDFSVSSIEASVDDILIRLVETIDNLNIGPFSYSMSERRGKWWILISHPFSTSGEPLRSKLDISPPPWLKPVRRGWVPMPVHAQYGEPSLPKIQTLRLEENIAEKIARLNRATPARDLYDLCWVMENPGIVGKLDQDLIRRLAVLKIWVDANGLHVGRTYSKPGHKGIPFNPKKWLRDRSIENIDIDDIGVLATHVPEAKELAGAIRRHFLFLVDLDEYETVLANASEQDRTIALKALKELPNGQLAGTDLY